MKKNFLTTIIMLMATASCSTTNNHTSANNTAITSNTLQTQQKKYIDPQPITIKLKLSAMFDTIAKSKDYEITSIKDHYGKGFTEGFEYLGNNTILESDGGYDDSHIVMYNLEKNTLIKKVQNPKGEFAEGVTIKDNKIYQLTWKSNKLNIYSFNNFRKLKVKSYPNEGWGLCSDGTNLIASDGTSTINTLDSENLKVKYSYKVKTSNGRIIDNINELHCDSNTNYITANVFNSNYIIQFNKKTGIVSKVYDLTNIFTMEEKLSGHNFNKNQVMNGIAFDNITGEYLITGKNWKNIYKIKFK